MIFNSQSGLVNSGADPAREVAWAAWYAGHLAIMATVPGVYTAQRFLTDHPGHPPSLAMYGVASPDVFKGDYYQSIRGMGEWLPLIDRQWYRRNLFDGLATAPLVRESQVLLVADRAAPGTRDASDITRAFIWLPVAGVDRSTPFRGMAVVDASALPTLVALPDDVAIYRPASKRYENLYDKIGKTL